MKYYICELTTLIGEFEINTAIRFQTDGDDLEYANKIASTFWGEGEEDVEEGVYNFPSYITCFVYSSKEVSKEVYDALNGIITKLEVTV
jgi:hypothetical protein